eukprot:1360944-Amorphochlora_amoeboformis.AAC.1
MYTYVPVKSPAARSDGLVGWNARHPTQQLTSHQTSDIRHQTSDIRHQTSGIRHQTHTQTTTNQTVQSMHMNTKASLKSWYKSVECIPNGVTNA